MRRILLLLFLCLVITACEPREPYVKHKDIELSPVEGKYYLVEIDTDRFRYKTGNTLDECGGYPFFKLKYEELTEDRQPYLRYQDNKVDIFYIPKDSIKFFQKGIVK